MNLLTTKEICEIYKISRNTVDRWRREKGLPYIRVGSGIRFKEEDVKEWIEKHSKEN